ncbi:signal peptidase I [Streptomyces sp. NPDC002588]|uniref:signal peptidase I n=1 Tax=Streptomyces sp. NPDC002588 TaxID=3154419 RepID=UPI0033335B6F
MGGESTTRTAPRSGGGTSSGPVGSRTGQRLSGLVVALGLVLFLGGFVWGALAYRPYTVPTGSMTPTIDPGSRVLAQKLDGDKVRRGDVVVFKDTSWVSNALVVKRVVAVGGDTVACCTKGKLTVNGKQIEEPYLPPGSLAEITDFPTVKVPAGRLFLLGDERQGSLDSTAHLTDAAQGTVASSAVRARVDAVVWPWDGFLKRPTGFETLGTISQPGPLRPILWMIGAGVVLILGGSAYGPIAKRTSARRVRAAKPEPAGAR